MASLNGADTAEKKLTIAMEFGLGVAASCRRHFCCCPDSLTEILDHFFGPRFYRRKKAQGELVKTPFKGVVIFSIVSRISEW